MKTFDFIKANIGNLVYCENHREYSFNKMMHAQIANRPLVIIELTKSGLVKVQNLDGDLIKLKATSLREYDDGSINDADTIQQIATYSIKYNNTQITRKVKEEFMYVGLYPHIQKKFDIMPDKKI